MSALSAGWKSWDDVPVVLARGQVMELLGVASPTTFYKLADDLVKSGKKIGSGYKYTKASVLRYCQKQQLDPFQAKK